MEPRDRDAAIMHLSPDLEPSSRTYQSTSDYLYRQRDLLHHNNHDSDYRTHHHRRHSSSSSLPPFKASPTVPRSLPPLPPLRHDSPRTLPVPAVSSSSPSSSSTLLNPAPLKSFERPGLTSPDSPPAVQRSLTVNTRAHRNSSPPAAVATSATAEPVVVAAAVTATASPPTTATAAATAAATAPVTGPLEPRYIPTTAPNAVRSLVIPPVRSHSADSGIERQPLRSTTHQAGFQERVRAPPVDSGGGGVPYVNAPLGMDQHSAQVPLQQHYAPYPEQHSLPTPPGALHVQQPHGMHAVLPERYSPHHHHHYAPGVHQPFHQAYPPPGYIAQPISPQPSGTTNGQPTKKKASRAQQACDQCRNRKQRCDEGRPCNFCSKEGHECNYREAAIPKTTQMLQERIDQVLAHSEQVNKSISWLANQLGLNLPDGDHAHASLKRKSDSTHRDTEDSSPRGLKAPYSAPPPAEGAARDENERVSTSAGHPSQEAQNEPAVEATLNAAVDSEIEAEASFELAPASASNPRLGNYPLSRSAPITRTVEGPDSDEYHKSPPVQQSPNGVMQDDRSDSPPNRGLTSAAGQVEHESQIYMGMLPVAHPEPGPSVPEVIHPPEHYFSQAEVCPPTEEDLSYFMGENYSRERLAQMVDFTQTFRDLEEDDFELGGVPPDHTTSVDYLRHWPEIKVLYREAGLLDSPTITSYELSRGKLRLWGVGQDPDEPLRSSKSPSPEPRPADQEQLQCQLGMMNLPGPELFAKVGFEGAVLPNLSLNLEKARIERLCNCYFETFHKITPFLDVNRIRALRTAFVRDYGTKSGASFQGDSGSPIPAVSTKATGERLSDPDVRRQPEGEARPIERTLSNAVMLLLLANGRIAEHKGHISSPVELTMTQLPPVPLYDSPHAASSPTSPARHGSPATYGSPATSGSSDMPSPIPEPYMGRRDKKLNVDVIPGLAYYAAGITALESLAPPRRQPLLRTPDDNLIHRMWAYILAALYMGQLLRVRESFEHITTASKIWMDLKKMFLTQHVEMILFRSNISADVNVNKVHDKNINLTRAGFWTILQMESDIRAECEFADTGLGKIVKQIPEPQFGSVTVQELANDIASKPISEHDLADMYFSLSLQITFRRLLNRTHNLMYDVNRVWPSNSVTEEAQLINEWLTSLHNSLCSGNPSVPEGYGNWPPDDPRSPIPNIARARGKYYGARYLIFRLFLQSVMRWKTKTAPPGAFEEQMRNINPVHTTLPDLSRISPPLMSMRSGEEIDDTCLTVQEKWIWIRCAMQAISAALHSTVAFDGLFDTDGGTRLLVTNLHGTSTAQYGNMLVVTAAYLSWLHPIIPIYDFVFALRRTIKLLNSLRHLSKIMGYHADVLITALRLVREKWRLYDPASHARESEAMEEKVAFIRKTKRERYPDFKLEVHIKSANSSFGN